MSSTVPYLLLVVDMLHSACRPLGEWSCRSQVLRKLGMIDSEGIVTLKGRAACEIDTADELLTTEMMFNGTLNGLDKHQLVALVSCLVPGEKSQASPHVPLRSCLLAAPQALIMIPGDAPFAVAFLH